MKYLICNKINYKNQYKDSQLGGYNLIPIDHAKIIYTILIIRTYSYM